MNKILLLIILLCYNNLMPSNTKFGFFFSFIFLLTSSYFFLNNDNIYLLFVLLSFIFFLLTFIIPSSLSLLNLGWFKLGILLGRIMNPVIISFIFFILITPVALIIKIIGRDELRIKKKKYDSYWKIYSPNVSNSEDYKNQF